MVFTQFIVHSREIWPSERTAGLITFRNSVDFANNDDSRMVQVL